MAEAYQGYKFYLPVFLDFRGRAYRCGSLNFNECDLVRSLILFDSGDEMGDLLNTYTVTLHYISAAFHYNSSFNTYAKAYNWMLENIEILGKDMPVQPDGGIDEVELITRLTERGIEAKNPIQFISKVHNLFHNKYEENNREAANTLYNFPITQDASASTYQLMSYFMLDDIMAMRTNLINEGGGGIQDIYSCLLEELKSFLKEELDESVYTTITEIFTRKFVKGIFMPLIYGKTIMSTHEDIRAELSQYLTHKECFHITRLCFKFWTTKYAHMDCLIRLIRIIG